MEAHLRQYAVYHTQIQAHHFSLFIKEFEKMKSMLQNQSERMVALKQHSAQAERRVEALEQRSGGGFSADTRDQLGSRVNSLEKELSQMS